jgi:hypothetical protein
VKTALKIIGIVCALVLLGGVMAYLAGFFETKIPVDFLKLQPSRLLSNQPEQCGPRLKR